MDVGTILRTLIAYRLGAAPAAGTDPVLPVREASLVARDDGEQPGRSLAAEATLEDALLGGPSARAAPAQRGAAEVAGAAARRAPPTLDLGPHADPAAGGRTPSPATATAFSATAQLLAPLLAASYPQAHAVRAAPDFPDVAHVGAPEVAARLRTSVETSGLFYESHLAEWVAGQRPLASLRAEPQAQWPAAGSAPAASQAPADATPAVRPDASAAAPALAPQAAEIVAHQLEVLGTSRIVWEGTPWRDQPVHVEIADEGGGRGAGDAPAPQDFVSRLVAELPRLGRVEATIRIDRAGVRIALAAPAASAAALAAARESFAAALAAAGLPLAQMNVEAR